MGFTDAIKTCFRNYLGFSGRAGRSEYWYWMLFVILLWIVALLLDLTVLAVFNTTGVPIMILLAILAIRLVGAPDIAGVCLGLHARHGGCEPLRSRPARGKGLGRHCALTEPAAAAKPHWHGRRSARTCH
jgi:hypothetical protein